MVSFQIALCEGNFCACDGKAWGKGKMITHLVAWEPVWSANRSTGPREVTDDVINSFKCITLRLPPLPISLDSKNMLFSLHKGLAVYCVP